MAHAVYNICIFYLSLETGLKIDEAEYFGDM